MGTRRLSEDTKLAHAELGRDRHCSYDDSLAADDEALVQPPRRQWKHVVEDIDLARRACQLKVNIVQQDGRIGLATNLVHGIWQ